MSVSVFYSFIALVFVDVAVSTQICVVVISSVSDVAVSLAVTLSGDRHEGSIPANVF